MLKWERSRKLPESQHEPSLGPESGKNASASLSCWVYRRVNARSDSWLGHRIVAALQDSR